LKALACERAHEPRPHHREALAVDAEPRGEISRFVGRRVERNCAAVSSGSGTPSAGKWRANAG
jgi:hypothetical protein